MANLLIYIAIATQIYLIYLILEFRIGFKKIKKLSHQEPLPINKLPSVTIILSALNEEKNLEASLISLLNLDYPNYNVIAINDRSTDKTPDILNRLKKEYSKLEVIHINHLPENWFGKSHALHTASQQASGEWFLFTDADVTMHKDTLSKAITYAVENKLDHLTLQERHPCNQYWFKTLMLAHYVSYNMTMKPWRIRYLWSRKSMGRGAFNLVRTQAYQECGGHKTIAMECLDDLKLGALFKKNGYMQDIVDGQDFVEFKWYSSLKEMITGLEKNSFAYFNYKLFPILRDFIFALLFFIWPFIAATFFKGWVQGLNLINIGLTLYLFLFVAKQYGVLKRYAFSYPIGMSILLFTVWNSVSAVYRHKGVVWRGTHYSIEKLKKSLL